jgi:hypothetical protein
MSDPSGNEVYDNSVSDKDREELKKNFDEARKELNDVIAAAVSIAKNGGRAVTKDAKELLARMERARKSRSVTDEDVKKIAALARKELLGIGGYGKGIVVSRSEIYTTESGKTNGSTRASAQLNANNITIYDSYFDERYKSKRIMAIIHEGSHAIFGRTDGVYTSRNVDDARNFSAGYDNQGANFIAHIDGLGLSLH